MVISPGVIITPQAWIPVFLTEPSSIVALLIVSEIKSFPKDKLFSSSTNCLSSDLKPATFPLLFASSPKIFFSLIKGINFAILSASKSGKSKTLAVSLMEDFAAIVP